MNYYDKNARDFFDSTIDVDLTTLYAKFTPLVIESGLILDAGCGSGRDSKAFKELGFQVYAIDSSCEMARFAEELTKQTVEVTTFQSFESDMGFDGVWACASLLHVPFQDLPLAFAKLALPLKSNGAFYCSFKYGDSEVERDGRTFTNLNEQRLLKALEGAPLKVIETWCTDDLRKGREHEKWLNALLMKE